DRDGDFWIGSETAGIRRVLAHGFERVEGLAAERVEGLATAPEGGLLVLTSDKHRNSLYLARADGVVQNVTPAGVEKLATNGQAVNRILLRAHLGAWWLGTSAGLWRFPALTARELRGRRPSAIYGAPSGLASEGIYALYEDRTGDLWISTYTDGGAGVSRWRRGSATIEPMPQCDRADGPIAMATAC